MHDVLSPKGWRRPKGYANGVAAEGRLVFTAGVVGWNENETFECKDFLGQFEQTLRNIVAILNEAGAAPEHLVRMTCYVTDKRQYLNDPAAVGAVWRNVLGRVFPCMAVVEVKSLMEDDALVEIEATAVIPKD